MKFDDLIATITPATFEKLLAAVETGRWPDGVQLSAKQRDHSLQLIIAYQARYLPGEDLFTVGADGQLIVKPKAQVKASLEQAIARFSLVPEDSPKSNS